MAGDYIFDTDLETACSEVTFRTSKFIRIELILRRSVQVNAPATAYHAQNFQLYAYVELAKYYLRDHGVAEPSIDAFRCMSRTATEASDVSTMFYVAIYFIRETVVSQEFCCTS